jgi:hypothetical protein
LNVPHCLSQSAVYRKKLFFCDLCDIMKRQTDDDSPADKLSPLKSDRNYSRHIVPKLSLGLCPPLWPADLDNSINASHPFEGEGYLDRVVNTDVFTFGDSSTALFTKKSANSPERRNHKFYFFSSDLTKSPSFPDESAKNNDHIVTFSGRLVTAAGHLVTGAGDRDLCEAARDLRRAARDWSRAARDRSRVADDCSTAACDWSRVARDRCGVARDHIVTFAWRLLTAAGRLMTGAGDRDLCGVARDRSRVACEWSRATRDLCGAADDWTRAARDWSRAARDR